MSGVNRGFRVGLIGFRQIPVTTSETIVSAPNIRVAEQHALTKAKLLSQGSGIVWEAVTLGRNTRRRAG